MDRKRSEPSDREIDAKVKVRKLSSAAQNEEAEFQLHDVIEILEQVFLYLPPHQVVHACRLVCHKWKQVADSPSYWMERCRKEGFPLGSKSPTFRDWRLFYYLNKKRRNLIKNPSGEDNLDYWLILENGGDGWSPHNNREPHPNNTVQKNFATSYEMAKKSQLIDLEKEGYNATFMDYFQPDIKISDWYTQLIQCGCEYEICVELLNQKLQIVDKFAPMRIHLEGSENEKWHQITHVFQNYGPGVRYIHFTHGGKDTMYWAGWYGVRITDSSVEICPDSDT